MPRSVLGLYLAFVFLLNASIASAQASLYSLQTFAGSDFVGDSGPASAALLTHLEGVAIDVVGNIYIADADNHRVRKISASGTISTLAGNGHPGFSGDGGPAASSQLRTPYGLATDRNGNVFIADLGNARIRRVSAGGTITTIAGGGSIALAQADGRSATDVALNSPRNLAVDSFGTFYFSDFGGHRVFTITSTGALGLIAGTGIAGLSGDGGAARGAQLSAPAGLATDASGAIYIADSGNGRIRKVLRGLITTVGDTGVPGAKLAVGVVTPTGLAMDPDGSLFIADVGGGQITRVTPSMTVTSTSQMARDIAIDSAGNMYACLDGVLYRRPRFGNFTAVAGNVPSNYVGDGGPLLNAQFSQPSGVARDALGNLYIVDTQHHRVRKISAEGRISTFAGTGTRGYAGDRAQATAAQLDTPVGIAVDSAGGVYIADTGNHRVRKVDSAGIITTIAGSGVRGRSPDGTVAIRVAIDTPAWLAIDHDGALVFSETGTHSVRRITSAGLLATVAGNQIRGFTGDGGLATSASLDTPQGIAVDAAGNIYIADAGNHRIRKVSLTSTITTVPGSDDAIWRGLRGLAVDGQGSLYATDAVDARAFRIDPNGRVLTIAGTGVAGFSGESGFGLEQALDTPSGIAIDALGIVYLIDSGNARIRKLTPAGDTISAPPSTPQISSLTVVNAASLTGGAIAPGEIITIFGSDLAQTQVVMNGAPAQQFFSNQTQINLQAPSSIAGSKSCDIQVIRGGAVKAQATVAVAEAAPAFFAISGGTGQAAALNEDGTMNSASNMADRGSVIVLFATGEGIAPLPVSLKIGDYSAEILYAGAAPGFAGLFQINARIPAGFAPPGILPVILQVGTVASPAGVTIAVR